jgi:hypothetical protein
LSIQHFDLNGIQRTYHAGDWVDIGKQQALRLISLGDARSVVPIAPDFTPHAGIIITNNEKQGRDHLTKSMLKMPVTAGPPQIKYDCTVIWDAAVPLRVDLLKPGIDFLDKWEIAVPLLSYTTLARDIGTPEERSEAELIIRDLRVPLYDTRLMFVRRCEATELLFELWQADTGNTSLAFLKALYQVKPLILALPVTWSGGKP